MENLKKLLAVASKPPLYQKTEEAFWQEDYISQQMLINHLDFDNDGASRSITFIQQSVNWLIRKFPVSKFPRVLD